MLKICLVGASGRMGREIVRSIEELSATSQEKPEVVAGIVEEGNAAVENSLEGIKYKISTGWCADYSECNVIIDFSNPEGSLLALRLAAQHKLPILVCTTGLGPAHESAIRETSQIVPVIRASNTSVGVNVMLQLVQDATRALVEGFDIELTEIHHRMKKDAPSGTALALANKITEARGRGPLSDIMLTGRSGNTGERTKEEIGVLALRGGDVSGEHTVFFFGNGERLEITHRATNRRIFADGAVKAALWLVKQAKRGPGLFSMADVLGLSSPKAE